MWELDDGIIEGALMTRYNDDKEILIRREDGEGVPDDLWRYHLLLKDQLLRGVIDWVPLRHSSGSM